MWSSCRTIDDMLKLWFSADEATQLLLFIQAVVCLASGASFVATYRKVQLERQSKAEQALILATVQRDADTRDWKRRDSTPS